MMTLQIWFYLVRKMFLIRGPAQTELIRYLVSQKLACTLVCHNLGFESKNFYFTLSRVLWIPINLPFFNHNFVVRFFSIPFSI